MRGIGFTPAECSCCIDVDGEPSALEDISDYQEFSVCRLPEIGSYSQSQLDVLRDKIIHAAMVYNFKEYPPADAFDEIIKNSRWITRGLARPVLRKMLAGVGTIAPGPFCSQLFADLCADVGADLFTRTAKQSTVTPNLLAKSRLKPVNGLIINGEQAIPVDSLRVSLANLVALPVRNSFSMFGDVSMHLKEIVQFRQRLGEELERLAHEDPEIQIRGKDRPEVPEAEPAVAIVGERALKAQVQALQLIQESDLEFIRRVIRAEGPAFSLIKRKDDIGNDVVSLVKSGLFAEFETEAFYRNKRLANVRPLVEFMDDVGGWDYFTHHRGSHE